MNRTLLDPFQSVQLPEVIEEYLDHGQAKCIALNSRGTLCAAGCASGDVVIWDMETRGVARTFKPHSDAVGACVWARDGRLLLSGGADGHVVWWDMAGNVEAARADVGGAVVRLSIVPRQPRCCLVSLAAGAPRLVTLPEAGGEATVVPVPSLVIEGEGKSSALSEKTAGLVALGALSACGQMLYVAQSRGTLLVLGRDKFDVLDIIRVSGSPRPMHMALNRKGTHLLLSASDRCVRMYETRSWDAERWKVAPLQELRSKVAVMKVPKQGSLLHGSDPMLIKVREFHNAVERCNWRAAAFTSDSEHVVAAPDSKAQHTLYIWSRVWGKLERILEGPKEGCVDLAAHPTHSMLLSVATSGKVYVWATVYRENWSAFAPDFEELEENQEYIEREDEFDANPRPEEQQAPEASSGAAGDDDEDVDILGVEAAAVLSSDEEGDEEGLYHLPVDITPEEDDEAGPAAGVGSGGTRDGGGDAAARTSGASKGAAAAGRGDTDMADASGRSDGVAAAVNGASAHSDAVGGGIFKKPRL